MTTLILSSIIALLVIAGSAILIGRWMHHCARHAELMRQISESTARSVKLMESLADLVEMERLLRCAKDILNKDGYAH